jgi:putative transposase
MSLRLALFLEQKCQKFGVLTNVFTERLWRTVKYEDIYLKQSETIPEARIGLTDYFHFYNTERVHQSLNYHTPADLYVPSVSQSTTNRRSLV